MTLRDDVAKVMRDGEPRTTREIAFEIFGPMRDADLFAARIHSVDKECRKLRILGLADMIGKKEQVGQFVKVYKWRCAS